MPVFIVRVELHYASGSDYTNLHHAMTSAGFVHTITSDDGRVFKLPTAQYSVVTNSSLNAVHEAAKGAAQRTINVSATAQKFAVFVSNTTANQWQA
ncbi:type V toxin-antitoxin system endoribonuclease antitoxin GhoS [Gluconobacter cerinus]|uniref:type V toxin-antitoxin system endoribonuclease antitoxin GhoS n=1 Tax=Gluconobacter cerinus TaxID=38307 RepID=UPI0039E76910